jgi:hypothetical protein
MSSNRIRWGGLATMAGGVLGILYSPFVALAFFATKDGAKFADSRLVAAWTGIVRPVLKPFLGFASPEYVHLIYGSLLVFVVLGLREGLKALHSRQDARAGRLEKWGFRIALVGSVLLTIGSIGAFWIGGLVFALSRSHTDLVINTSYLVFSLPGLLFFMFGTTLFGIGALRARVAPRLGTWLLIVGGFPGIIVMAFLVGNWGGSLLLADLAWIVLGYSLWSEKSAPVPQAAPVR